METYPNFKMFAVLKDSIVIDCGFGDVDEVASPLTKKTYDDKNYTLIQVTEKNSPFIIGSIYKEGE